MRSHPAPRCNRDRDSLAAPRLEMPAAALAGPTKLLTWHTATLICIGSWQVRRWACTHYICGSGGLQALPIACPPKNHGTNRLPVAPDPAGQSFTVRPRLLALPRLSLSPDREAPNSLARRPDLGCITRQCSRCVSAAAAVFRCFRSAQATPVSRPRNHGLGKTPVRPTQP